MLATYRRIFSLLAARERRMFAGLIVLMLAAGVAEVAGVATIIPLLAVIADPGAVETNATLAWAYELGGFDDVRAFLGALCLGVFAVVLVSALIRVAANYGTARFTREVVLILSQSLLTKYLRNPYEWYLSRHSADLAKSLLTETKEVVNGSITPAMKLVSDAIATLAMLIFLLQLNPLGALLTAAFVGGAFSLIYWRLHHMLREIGEDRRTANRERYQIAQEALGGIKDVKVMDLEETYIQRFRAPSQRLARHMAALQLVGEVPRYALEVLGFGGMLLFLFFLLSQTTGDPAGVLPIFGAFALAGLRLLPTLQTLFRSITQMRFHQSGLEALFGELREVTGPAPDPAGARRLPLDDALVLDGIGYGYPGAEGPSLSGVSLTIPARTSCGFVGSTGAGKTTLIDIVLGLLVPQSGQIRVDGTPVDTTTLRAWQRSIGYVQQSVHLVDDSIAANIAYGVAPERIDTDRVAEAGRLASLDAFVQTLPAGYETTVGDRGVRLSGGQRQRIGIARALYRDPEVIVFDEATSALDSVTERAIMDEIGALSGQKTVLIVTHRLSTVAGCDQIVVLEDGRIDAIGTYDALASGDGAFRRLVAGQEAAASP